MDRLREIQQLENPAERLQALHLVALALLQAEKLGGANDPSLADLSELMAVVAATIREIRVGLATAEESSLPRMTANGLLRSLSVLEFARARAFSLDAIRAGGSLCRWPRASGPEVSGCEQFLALLELASEWRLGFHRTLTLRQSLQSLSSAEQAEFLEINERLALALKASLREGPCDNGLAELLDRSRELRAIAQAGCEKSTDNTLGKQSRFERCIYVVDLAPAAAPRLYGLIAVSPLWISYAWSSAWSQLAGECGRAVAKGSADLVELDRILERVSAVNWPPMSGLMGELAEDTATGTEHLGAFQNLTDVEIPFDCISGWNCRTSTGTDVLEHMDRSRTVSFWGCMAFRRRKREEIDDVRRRISCDGVEIAAYPHLPDFGPRLVGGPAPLPFSHYERWMIEDLQRDHGVAVQFHTGADAVRNAFLTNDWHTVSAIHVTTHGTTDRAVELSNLLFAEVDDEPTRIHFLDVLARDWSNVQLVFLNACMTAAGRKYVGESALSIGWAFLAGGARFVIACRWQVEDRLACEFARQFYTRWFAGDARGSVAESFRGARTSLRCDQRFCRPSQWGAFVLLENPTIERQTVANF